MAKKQENVTIEHIKAGHFRVAAADSAHLSVATDSLGTTFHLTFTRLDKSPTSETFSAEILEGGGIVQVGPPTFDDPLAESRSLGSCSARTTLLMSRSCCYVSFHSSMRGRKSDMAFLISPPFGVNLTGALPNENRNPESYLTVIRQKLPCRCH